MASPGFGFCSGRSSEGTCPENAPASVTPQHVSVAFHTTALARLLWLARTIAVQGSNHGRHPVKQGRTICTRSSGLLLVTCCSPFPLCSSISFLCLCHLETLLWLFLGP